MDRLAAPTKDKSTEQNVRAYILFCASIREVLGYEIFIWERTAIHGRCEQRGALSMEEHR